MLSSWVIWVGSKCSNGSPYKREEWEILRLRHTAGRSHVKREVETWPRAVEPRSRQVLEEAGSILSWSLWRKMPADS